MKTYQSFLISFISHVALLIFIFLISQKKTYINISNQSINFQNVVNIDAVGLPNILKKDIQKIQTIKNKTLAISPNDMVLPTSKLNAISKLKAISRLKNKIAKNSYLNKIKTIKETVFSKTKQNPKQDSEIKTYFSKIQKLVNTNWEIPNWTNLEDKKILIKCILNISGKLISLEIIQSSGNTKIDETAISAIKKSVPFPEVPSTFTETLKQGIVFSFP